MTEAYIVCVDDLIQNIQYFRDADRTELLKYVPMGSNYCDRYHGYITGSQKSSVFKNCNKLDVYYSNTKYYLNTTMNLEEHMKRADPPMEHNIVVHPHIFGKIYANIIDPNGSRLLQPFLIQKCTFDSMKRNKYNYEIKIHQIVKLLESENALIQQWLESRVGVRGFATNEKQGPLDPNSYESLYKNDSMSIREHVEMYLRDNEQCNYNTVHHGTNYLISITQSQFDMLKNAYTDDEKLTNLLVNMQPVIGTNAVTEFTDSREVLQKPLSHDQAIIASAKLASLLSQQSLQSQQPLLQLRKKRSSRCNIS